MKSSTQYFHMKTKILADFQICISAPLRLESFTGVSFQKSCSSEGLQLYQKRLCELFKNTYFKEQLRTAGSETLVQGFLFNKVASLMAWRPLTVLERDSSTGIFLQVLCNFKESFFVEQILATLSCMMFLLLLLLFLQISEVCSLKPICQVK